MIFEHSPGSLCIRVLSLIPTFSVVSFRLILQQRLFDTVEYCHEGWDCRKAALPPRKWFRIVSIQVWNSQQADRREEGSTARTSLWRSIIPESQNLTTNNSIPIKILRPNSITPATGQLSGKWPISGNSFIATTARLGSEDEFNHTHRSSFSRSIIVTWPTRGNRTLTFTCARTARILFCTLMNVESFDSPSLTFMEQLASASFQLDWTSQVLNFIVMSGWKLWMGLGLSAFFKWKILGIPLSSCIQQTKL